MQLMRAIFRCGKAHLTEVVIAYEKEKALELDLTIHEDSPEEETMVSGKIFSVMNLIGAMADHGLVLLDEAWVYEC